MLPRIGGRLMTIAIVVPIVFLMRQVSFDARKRGVKEERAEGTRQKAEGKNEERRTKNEERRTKKVIAPAC
jgi:hypothetical protein